jgi:hypothetical protein
MGFSLKSWASHALKLPKAVREINVGKSLRQAGQAAVNSFEGSIQRTAGNLGGSLGGTVSDVREGATAAKSLPWILGIGLAAVVAIMVWRRR